MSVFQGGGFDDSFGGAVDSTGSATTRSPSTSSPDSSPAAALAASFSASFFSMSRHGMRLRTVAAPSAFGPDGLRYTASDDGRGAVRRSSPPLALWLADVRPMISKLLKHRMGQHFASERPS